MTECRFQDGVQRKSERKVFGVVGMQCSCRWVLFSIPPRPPSFYPSPPCRVQSTFKITKKGELRTIFTHEAFVISREGEDPAYTSPFARVVERDLKSIRELNNWSSADIVEIVRTLAFHLVFSA